MRRISMEGLCPVGATVVLDYMDDMQAPVPGTKGKVTFVDDIGNIHVNWETGSSLALIPGIDQFHIVMEKEKEN